MYNSIATKDGAVKFESDSKFAGNMVEAKIILLFP
jgi:hypothetical protein